jgi:hypothetical protein
LARLVLEEWQLERKVGLGGILLFLPLLLMVVVAVATHHLPLELEI